MADQKYRCLTWAVRVMSAAAAVLAISVAAWVLYGPFTKRANAAFLAAWAVSLFVLWLFAILAALMSKARRLRIVIAMLVILVAIALLFLPLV